MRLNEIITQALIEDEDVISGGSGLGHGDSVSSPIAEENDGYFLLFLKKICITIVLFVGPLIPLFWISGDICPGFQSQAIFFFF